MTLFVSKKVTDLAFTRFIEDNNIVLIDQPMIDFEAVDFDCPKEDYDVLFFTSPRSASFFLRQCAVSKLVNIATIGASTTLFVESKGYNVSFTGLTSGEPDVVSKEFKAFIKGRKVLFPQSNHSQQSIQNVLSKEQVVNLVVYKTILIPVRIEDYLSILVFTSPTNVRSFLMKNKIKREQKVIAWGKTTAGYLNQEGIAVDFTLKYSSFEELESLLRSMVKLNNHSLK